MPLAEKKFKGSPFGTQSARFDVSGVHPKVKLVGTFTEIPYDKKSLEELKRRLGPGSYHVDVGGFNRKSVEDKASGPGWARAFELERMSALPHLLHKEQWEMKKELVRKLGPGSYEFKDFVQCSELKPRSARGICATRSARFTGVPNEVPGPGTYGKGGVPFAAIAEKETQSMSTIGMLDSGLSASRSAPPVGSRLGPGTYNFKSFAENILNKMTSTRGPYDIFTGDRNKPIIVGHSADPKLADLGPGQYKIKSFLDEWQSEHRKRQGCFGTVSQYPQQPTDRVYCSTLSQCPKEPAQPGPSQYTPQELSKPESKKAPGFFSSSQRNDKQSQQFFTRNFNPVGPGRYDVQKWEESQSHNGNRSVFQAKTGRLSLSMEKFLKERLREKDVRVEDRVFLVQPQGPPGCELNRLTAQENFSKSRAMTII